MRQDPPLQLVAVPSETEAVTIAAGAALRGERFGVSSHSLAAVAKPIGVPPLLASGYLGGFDDQRNNFLYGI